MTVREWEHSLVGNSDDYRVVVTLEVTVIFAMFAVRRMTKDGTCGGHCILQFNLSSVYESQYETLS